MNTLCCLCWKQYLFPQFSMLQLMYLFCFQSSITFGQFCLTFIFIKAKWFTRSLYFFKKLFHKYLDILYPNACPLLIQLLFLGTKHYQWGTARLIVTASILSTQLRFCCSSFGDGCKKFSLCLFIEDFRFGM